MSRVITFSTKFPSYHPKAGQPTDFVSKLWKSFAELNLDFNLLQFAIAANQPGITVPFNQFTPKWHTIRAGSRWKAGDKFSPRIWSGKPYQSKQIIIGPDIEIKKVWQIELMPSLWWDECRVQIEGVNLGPYDFERLATFDGLSPRDMLAWLAGPNMADSRRKPFVGQIVCWNENVRYGEGRICAFHGERSEGPWGGLSVKRVRGSRRACLFPGGFAPC